MRMLGLALATFGLGAVVLLGGAVVALGGATGAAGLNPASGIPAELVPVIQQAAPAYCDLPPPLLAAVLKVESGFDNTAVNPRSGAFTMAQFLPATWQQWKVNGNPKQGATIDPAEIADVIFSAAHYLCALGADSPDTQRPAVAAYHTGPRAVQQAGGIPHEADCPNRHPRSLDRRCETADYVRTVFAQAATYAADTALELPAGDLLARVIGFAYAKIGTPTSGAATEATATTTAPGSPCAPTSRPACNSPAPHASSTWPAPTSPKTTCRPATCCSGPTTPATPAASTMSPSTWAATATAPSG
jgi:Transglycosylase SLT domain